MNKIKAYDVIIVIVMVLLVFFCLAPIFLLLMSSLTDNSTLMREGYSFFPEVFSLDAYEYLLQRGEKIFRAYYMSFVVTGVGTVVSMVLTTTLAYAISRSGLPGKTFLTFFVLLTFLFNGGLVPTYLMYTSIIDIKDTILAQIVPNLLVRAFHVLLMRSFFLTNLPGEVLDAAAVDGAGEFRIFWNIALPMSKPIIATVFLFQMIMYWNDWQNGLYFITKDLDLYTIQNLLNQMIKEIQYLASSSTGSETAALFEMPSQSVRMAIAVIGIIPIGVIYPFIQKNFVKGITIGAVKG